MSKYAICDGGGIFCFEKVMKFHESLHGSNATKHCLPSCHQVRFTSNQYIEKLDAETVCNDTTSIESNIAIVTSGVGDYTSSETLLFMTRKLKELLNGPIGPNVSIDLETMKNNYCKNLVKQDLARITVMFESKKYVRTRTNRRVTFSERLGAFGKIFLIKKFMHITS